MKDKLEIQVEQLQKVIANLEKEKEMLSKGIDTNEPYLITFLKYKNINHIERGMLVELVNVIYIHNGGELTIEFNFSDQHRQIVEYIECNNQKLKVLESKKAI